MKTEILLQLQTIFNSIFDSRPQLSPELSANDIEGWDSLNNVKLIIAIEKKFGIEFELGVMESLQNIDDLVSLIDFKLNEKK